MRIDLWTIGLQAINFLVLVYILGRLFFRPVAQMIADRQTQARTLLADAAQAMAEAEEERAKSKAGRAAIDADRAEALRNAVAHASETHETLYAQARADAEHIRSEARAEMARARDAEERILQQEAGRLAIDIAAKALARLSPGAKLDGLVERLTTGASALPMAVRNELPTSQPATLAAAVPLTPSLAQACEAALTGALGHPVELRIEHDPALIAGFELRLPSATVRDNVRADLERIAAALTATTRGGGV